MLGPKCCFYVCLIATSEATGILTIVCVLWFAARTPQIRLWSRFLSHCYWLCCQILFSSNVYLSIKTQESDFGVKPAWSENLWSNHLTFLYGWRHSKREILSTQSQTKRVRFTRPLHTSSCVYLSVLLCPLYFLWLILVSCSLALPPDLRLILLTQSESFTAWSNILQKATLRIKEMP